MKAFDSFSSHDKVELLNYLLTSNLLTGQSSFGLNSMKESRVAVEKQIRDLIQGQEDKVISLD